MGTVAYHIEKGRLDTSKIITMKDLYDAGALSKIKYGVKLLGKGAEKFTDLKVPITLEISDASSTAIDAVRENGGDLKV